MEENRFDLPPAAKWHTSVSTLKCDHIDEYVSIMVKNDWSSTCTWYRQYKEVLSGDKGRAKPDKKIRKKIPLCQGPLCSYVVGYRDQLIKEEQEAKS
jgi:hypothetical protein